VNYIHKLQQEVNELKSQRDSLLDRLNELECYLLSDKFNCGDRLDGYVNCQDVLNRLPSRWEGVE
jgi:hypothetical protein